MATVYWLGVIVLLGVMMKLALGLKQRSGVLPAETTQRPAPPLPVISDRPTGEVAPALDVVQLKARLAAVVEAKAAAEVRLLANYPAWLVALGAQYRLRRADQLEPLQDWVALTLSYAQTHHDGKFPVKSIWRGMQANYGAAAPDKRLTSYRFFWRLSEVLIEQQLLIRGQRGRAARLVIITTLWPN